MRDLAITLDGVAYYFDPTGEDGGNRCLNCVTSIHDPSGLCERLPECMGGVWKQVQPTKKEAL
jgi:hypothetical protein